MPYRYLMHWYTDREAPLRLGRELFGRTLADAIAHAAELRDEATYVAACGYVIMDTDEGEVVFRREREHPPTINYTKLTSAAASGYP